MKLLFTVISRAGAFLVIAVPVVFCIIIVNNHYYHPPDLREGWQYTSGPLSLPFIYLVYVFSPWTFVSLLVAGATAYKLWIKKLTLFCGIILVALSLALSLLTAVLMLMRFHALPPGAKYVHESFY